MKRDDTISRQAAIDLLKQMRKDGDMIPWEGKDVFARIRKLPSAQPEIIRCKDCRWGRKVCGNIECFVDINVPPEYHGYEWYCPNGERRKE